MRVFLSLSLEAITASEKILRDVRLHPHLLIVFLYSNNSRHFSCLYMHSKSPRSKQEAKSKLQQRMSLATKGRGHLI